MKNLKTKLLVLIICSFCITTQVSAEIPEELQNIESEAKSIFDEDFLGGCIEFLDWLFSMN